MYGDLRCNLRGGCGPLRLDPIRRCSCAQLARPGDRLRDRRRQLTGHAGRGERGRTKRPGAPAAPDLRPGRGPDRQSAECMDADRGRSHDGVGRRPVGGIEVSRRRNPGSKFRQLPVHPIQRRVGAGRCRGAGDPHDGSGGGPCGVRCSLRSGQPTPTDRAEGPRGDAGAPGFGWRRGAVRPATSPAGMPQRAATGFGVAGTGHPIATLSAAESASTRHSARDSWAAAR